MEWNVVDCQGLEYFSDVHLRPAGDTEVNMRKLHVDKAFHYIEDLFSWRRVHGRFWALIESIDHEIERPLPWEVEHPLQAFHKRALAGLTGAIIVVHKKVERTSAYWPD
jgi:hypothetical protein